MESWWERHTGAGRLPQPGVFSFFLFLHTCAHTHTHKCVYLCCMHLWRVQESRRGNFSEHSEQRYWNTFPVQCSIEFFYLIEVVITVRQTYIRVLLQKQGCTDIEMVKQLWILSWDNVFWIFPCTPVTSGFLHHHPLTALSEALFMFSLSQRVEEKCAYIYSVLSVRISL